MRKHILLYTGEAGGKTTTALGLAMRALGHGQKVVMIQFLKGRKAIGEYKMQKKLKNFTIYQFGTTKMQNLRKPSEKTKKLMQDGLKKAEQVSKQKIDMLILDEINLVCAYKLLPVDDVLKTLKKVPKRIPVILTGRRAPQQLKRIADIVVRMDDIKRPKKISAQKGIEY
ncbi:cob(I)yrinic acid a,c-diamide adenosyltransferase [Candidatus Woesearchaeota archaeon]|nr:cob(I)yrinic acid a,c-diamide adenosyltransferase [Candidatus Woesearchaeota archaeon]